MAVRYDGVIVGEYMAGFLVEKLSLVEPKAVRALDGIHVAQGMNYLPARGAMTAADRRPIGCGGAAPLARRV